jgi:small-conductance mechanosensitive channel
MQDHMTSNELPASEEPFNGMLMALSVISRLICVLLGTMVIFRFMFDWTFMPTMLAGACAFAAAVIPPSRRGSSDHRSLTILVLALLGLVFQAADILVYYYLNDFNGKHYWWSGATAYFVGLSLMAIYGVVTLYNSRRRKAGPV